MSILKEILAHKRTEVKARKKLIARSAFESFEKFSFRRLSLIQASKKKPAIIAEIKKASPSKGIIRENFDAHAIAREYLSNGAAALSILTDEKYFMGRLEYLNSIKQFSSVPLLRKDFIVDRYQLYESKANGADAVLLIAAALDINELHDFADEAKEIDLECLVEVHTEEEVHSLDFNTVNIVGINNRDLRSFETDLSTSIRLRKIIPPDVVCVSESGIHSRADIEQLMTSGINAFLIGETLMKAESPGQALSKLLSHH